MIEVKLLQNSYCQLMNPLSAMENDKQAKDTEFTNKSTWMILVDQPELEARLMSCVGSKSIPITMRLSCFGTDMEV